ncbi:MAG TPA: hypothetical protein VMW74_05320 [Nitrosopumilaceae archaeon]|nr:hypothetical protein [Nitrosopumilaceae archaeon]
MNSSWVRRRWLDFRLGHGTYLIFLMAFGNFVLIFHRLLIERVEFLNNIFSELWFFIVIFILIYFPLAVLIGAWHRKTQIRVENRLTLYQNPVLAEWFRTVIDIQTGKASKEEIERIRKVLKKIEGKNDD